MNPTTNRGPSLLLSVLLAGPAAAVAAPGPFAQPPEHHHPEPAPPEPQSEERPQAEPHRHHPPAPEPPPAPEEREGEHETGHDTGHGMAMSGLLGPYPASREASGTAWQPDASPHEARHGMRGAWSWMAHARAHGVYTDQGGPRGDQELYSTNMAMGMARRPLGEGALGLRGMVSLEPLTVGKEGYPLLLQTGETADGETELVDRQHPHDFFMELAASYSLPVGRDGSVFLYAGLPGEPALGPPAYPHRFSAFESPEAPLAHHWLDSTHITFGVVTAGWVRGPVKLEASAFRGREPDEERWDLESPGLDSVSARLSWNPTPRWALQASHGRLEGPEQLEPDVDVDRTTVSAIRHGAWRGGEWQATVAWGRNAEDPGETLDAVLAEATVRLGGRHTLLARAERLENAELLHSEDEGGHGHADVFRVGELSAGYLYDLLRGGGLAAGVGGLARLSLVPGELEEVYDGDPVSWGLFARLALR